MTRHKHADVIHAYAEGAEIQFRRDASERWVDMDSPCFNPGFEYRIKPRTVKREGWVNIFSNQTVFDSREDAEAQKLSSCKATVKVEWEETLDA